MSENEGQEQKKPRARRSASKFIVLEDLGPVEQDITPDVADYLDGLGVHGVKSGDVLMVVRLTPSGIKAARAEIIKQKIAGDLLTVCVRRRGTSTVQTTLEIKGL